MNIFTDLRIHVDIISPYIQLLFKKSYYLKTFISGFSSHNLVCYCPLLLVLTLQSTTISVASVFLFVFVILSLLLEDYRASVT